MHCDSQISVRVPQDTYDKLAADAAKQYLTKSDLVRQMLIDKYSRRADVD